MNNPSPNYALYGESAAEVRIWWDYPKAVLARSHCDDIHRQSKAVLLCFIDGSVLACAAFNYQNRKW
jgi:hypothetical protein